jgi:hypothetical protein
LLSGIKENERNSASGSLLMQIIRRSAVAAKTKKIKADEVDNKFELGAFAIQNWWKIAVVIAVSGLAITGFSLKCGENEVVKHQINLRSAADVKKNE